MNDEYRSIWISADGSESTLSSIAGVSAIDARRIALDVLGCAHLRVTSNRIELALNPRTLTAHAIASSLVLIDRLQQRDPDRTLTIQVHDGTSRGSIHVASSNDLFKHLEAAMEMTTRPAHPLVHDRLENPAAIEIPDADARDVLNAARSDGYALTRQLVERVEAGGGRAKLVYATATGRVQYLAHDRWTRDFWGQPGRFAGRFLDDLPVPRSVKRSVRADALAVLHERGPIVSRIAGLREVLHHRAPVPDAYYRVSVRLTPTSRDDDIPVLMVLSHVG